jgi:RimJ/RimL family protein N-acetyltransferase
MEIRDIDEEHRQGELSFWIGTPFWNRGFAAEAGKVMIRYAFEQLRLNRGMPTTRSRTRRPGAFCQNPECAGRDCFGSA